jgi:hypothetical protein
VGATRLDVLATSAQMTDSVEAAAELAAEHAREGAEA